MEVAGAPGASAAQSEQAIVVAGSTEASGIVPKLQNIVATVNLGVKLDLKGVALHARNAEYNPKVLLCPSCKLQRCQWPLMHCLSSFSSVHALGIRGESVSWCLQRFSAVIMRIRDPKTTALIFASGKVVSSLMPSDKRSRLRLSIRFPTLVDSGRSLQHSGLERLKFKLICIWCY